MSAEPCKTYLHIIGAGLLFKLDIKLLNIAVCITPKADSEQNYRAVIHDKRQLPANREGKLVAA